MVSRHHAMSPCPPVHLNRFHVPALWPVVSQRPPCCRVLAQAWPALCFMGLWEVKSGSPHRRTPASPRPKAHPILVELQDPRSRVLLPADRVEGGSRAAPPREAQGHPVAVHPRGAHPGSQQHAVCRGATARIVRRQPCAHGLAAPSLVLEAPGRCPGGRQGHRPLTVCYRCGSPELVWSSLRLVEMTCDFVTAVLPFSVFCV